MDAGNMLKPALARGELHVVGATTIDEYRKYVEKDAALERRFQPVLVPESAPLGTVSRRCVPYGVVGGPFPGWCHSDRVPRVRSGVGAVTGPGRDPNRGLPNASVSVPGTVGVP